MFGLMDMVFPVMFLLMFMIVIGMFVYTAVSSLRQWNRNNHSPRLTVEARVVAKRTSTTQQPVAGDATGAHGFHTSTAHYVTFQVESGDRMEFHLAGREYGMLAEGDWGRLTFQGTRYLGFERQR